MAMRMVVFQIIVLLASMNAFVKAVALVNSSKCSEATCGNVRIPYPFGIDTDCNMTALYWINCSHSFSPPKPFSFLINPPNPAALAPLNLEVLDISLDGTLRVNYPMYWGCANATSIKFESFDHKASRLLVFNQSRNKFDAMGCYNFVSLDDAENLVLCECTGCVNNNSIGTSCCVTAIPVHDVFSASRTSTDPKTYTNNTCKSAFKAEKKWYDAYTVPMVLEWRIDPTLFPLVTGNKQPNEETSSYVCANRSSTLTCSCKPGFKGNPYLPHPERCLLILLL